MPAMTKHRRQRRLIKGPFPKEAMARVLQSSDAPNNPLVSFTVGRNKAGQLVVRNGFGVETIDRVTL